VTSSPHRPADDDPTPAAGGEPLWPGHPGRAPNNGPGPRRDEPDGDRTGSSGGGLAGFLRELPVLVAVALVLAFLLRSFVVQVFYIPSSSMEPTLMINDRMVVEKIVYRFREPRHGDIVVFEGPTLALGADVDNGVQRIVRGVGQFLGVVPASASDYVKRVIAVGGDEVEIVDGTVWVNGHALDEPYVVYDDHDDYGPVDVPEDHLFFLGDNRPNSSDSRRSLGFVRVDDVVGRAVVILWPPGHAGSLTSVHHVLPSD
jgi:signal peptidase I